MRILRGYISTFLLLALVLVGCGGDPIKNAADNLVQSASGKSWPEFCSLLTASSRKNLPVLLSAKGKSCADALQDAPDFIAERFSSQAKAVGEIEKIRTLSKSEAQVFLPSGNNVQFMIAKKENGSWRFDIFPSK